MVMTAALIAAVPAAWAQPSIYYLFEQKGTGNKICEPQAPDESWIRVGGPFLDVNCTIPETE
jgi:hypothetical protein